jgi:hypothetical protein
MSNPKQVYQLKVTLDDVKPPIWRRLLVAEDTSLVTLHEIIQRAMGWQNYHLHSFTIAGQIYGDPEDDEFGDLGNKDETRYRLNQLGLKEKARFRYEYDFGDGWEHTILVEKILPADPAVHYPLCVTGKRACPPEDVGGVWGYEEFLETIADPNAAEHDEMLEWVGGEFDPEEFDLEQVNQSLQHLKPSRGGKKSQPEPEESPEDAMPPEAMEQMEKLAAWFQKLTRDQVETFENLPLRKNMLVFLDYLSKNKVMGTQSTGNLPLKTVEAICANFTPPIPMEHAIGRQTFKVRSEDEVWPLFFVHHLAFHSLLVEGGQAKTWKVTQVGHNFIQSPAPVQVFLLFTLWWTEVDWMVVFSGGYGPSDNLPDGFSQATLACLQELSVGKKVAFESFASRLIEKGRLGTRPMMQMVVKRTVVDMMQMFGVLECEYGTEKVNEREYKKLANICLTPVGKGLLGFVK